MFYFSSTGIVASKARSAESVDSRGIGYTLQPSVMRNLKNPERICVASTQHKVPGGLHRIGSKNTGRTTQRAETRT